MRLISPIAVVLSAAASLAKSETISLTWGMTLATGEEILIAKWGDTTLESSCSKSLNLGGVDIKIDADTEARGSLIVGDKTHDLSDNSLCDAVWSPSLAEVSCEIPWDGDVPLARRSVFNSTSECFASAEEQQALLFIDDEGVIDEAESTHAEGDSVTDSEKEALSAGGSELAARQNLGCGGITIKRDRASPANPWKWRRHVQMTVRLNCNGNPSCSTGWERSYSVTHTASFNIQGLGKASWISAGYSVAWTKTNAQQLTCYGEKKDVVCLKQYRRFQQYDIHERRTTCGVKTEKKYTAYSPLSSNSQQEYYCARGTNHCRHEGYANWEDRGKGTHGGA